MKKRWLWLATAGALLGLAGACDDSDPGGTENRRKVFIGRYDGDNADADDDPFTGVDDGLLWVRVRIDGTHYDVETLIRE